MPSSDRARWLSLLATAWASSAAFLVGSEAMGAAFLFCLPCLVARALGRDARRRAIAILVALALPLQGIAAASMQARGPAHFHAGSAPHSHRHVEHHHHAHGSDAVSAEEVEVRAALAFFEENRRLDAAPAGTAPPALAAASAGVRGEPDPGVLLHPPAPHERPPRI